MGMYSAGLVAISHNIRKKVLLGEELPEMIGEFIGTIDDYSIYQTPEMKWYGRGLYLEDWILKQNPDDCMAAIAYESGGFSFEYGPYDMLGFQLEDTTDGYYYISSQVGDSIQV